MIRQNSHQINRRKITLLSVALCWTLLLLTACGPERGASSEEELVSRTQEIAQEFAATGDLDDARAQLSALDVANGNQWLIYVTESEIASDANPDGAAALVRLSDALGLESATINEFALQHNLLEGLAVALDAPGDAAAALPTPVEPLVAPAESAPTESAPTEAAIVAPSSALSSTAPASNDEAIAGAVTTAAAEEPSEDQAEAGGEAEQSDNAADGGALLPVPTPSPVSSPQPLVRATLPMNVRSGPDTAYAIVGAFEENDELIVVGKNEDGSWWEVELENGRLGWVYSQLVEQIGSFDTVAVAANIPPPPPTAVPVAAEPAPADALPAEPAPAEQAPAEAEVAPEEPSAPAADPAGPPTFTMIDRRLWSKAENGGCAGQHLLRINVIDANGVRINGVALKGIYVGEVLVTGAQGKGDGVIEYDLHGSGEGFYVMRNDDGREAVSDRIEGFTTRSRDIPKDVLINAGYCSDSADCDVFYSSYGCQGHHSYEATFQRNY